MYAQFNQNFPPPSNRPRGALYITDRAMDLMAPLVHEFTYQAMACDLLPINDGDKVTYRTNVNDEDPNSEEKDVEISDKDKIWVENRHRHMKDTLERLVGDFHKFIADNPQFTKQDEQNTQGMSGLNQIKDMIAGLPQFQEMKEAYSLHLTMAQKCMEIFQHHKLPDLATVEQVRYFPPNCANLLISVVPRDWTGRRLPQGEEHGRPSHPLFRPGRRPSYRSITPHCHVYSLQGRHLADRSRETSLSFATSTCRRQCCCQLGPIRSTNDAQAEREARAATTSIPTQGTASESGRLRTFAI
jgi:hypothetical protein